jgi:hypothetical protein
MPVPQHLQERLLVPEEDEADIEAERERLRSLRPVGMMASGVGRSN